MTKNARPSPTELRLVDATQPAADPSPGKSPGKSAGKSTGGGQPVADAVVPAALPGGQRSPEEIEQLLEITRHEGDTMRHLIEDLDDCIDRLRRLQDAKVALNELSPAEVSGMLQRRRLAIASEPS